MPWIWLSLKLFHVPLILFHPIIFYFFFIHHIYTSDLMKIEYEYGNKTTYGFEGKTQWYIWIGYLLFVIISSLIGDSTILIASLKYQAFKLQKVIAIIIQHIALCDLMALSSDIIPNFISLIAGKWVFGNILGYLHFYTRYYFGLAGVLLICAMTTSKVLLMRYPLRFGSISRRGAHKICVGCWLLSLSFPCLFLFTDWDDAYFSYRSYLWEYGFSSSTWKYIRPAASFIFGFVPISLVVTTTIYLLVIAKKTVRQHRGSLRWQGILTAVLTGAVYCISVLPHVIYNILDSNITVENKADSFFHTTFYRITRLFFCLNTISNFYIYSLTVPSFRTFVLSSSTHSNTFDSKGNKNFDSNVY